MNVVDNLVVTLGLDPSNFTKGQKQAAEALLKTQNQASRTAKEMQADGAKAAEFFGAIKTEFLGLIGVLLGSKGIEAFVRDQTKSLADLGREAKNIGVSIPVLAAFRNAVELNGGSAEAATASFRSLTDQMEHLKVYGNSPLMPFLNTIGASRGDDAMATYMKFVKYAQDHASDVPLINLVGHGLGLDQGSINEAMRGVAQVSADLGRAMELGAPTPEMVERITKMQRALTALELAATGAGNRLLSDAAPGITAVSTALTDWIVKNPNEAESILAISTALTTLGAVRVSANLMGLTGLVGALDGLMVLAARLSALSLPLLLSGDTSSDPLLNQKPSGPGVWGQGGTVETDIREWLRKNMPSWLGGGSAAPLADSGMTPEQQNFLKSLSGPESGGDYTVKNGGSHFTDFSRFPEGVGPGGTSTAAGRYQFTSDTWKDVSTALGLRDFSPANQDRAAWFLAQREYRTKTGRDLQGDLASGGHEADIATALNGRWPSLPGGSQYRGAPNGVPRTGPTFGSQPKIPPPPRLPPPPANNNGNAPPIDNSGQITVSNLVVNSRAADAAGIAKDIHRSLVAQANSGPQ